MSYIKINGVETPTPDELTISLNDVDGENSQRSLNKAILHRERIRANAYKINAVWNVSAIELEKIVTAITPKSFNVTFFDATSFKFITAKMYAGVKTAKLTTKSPMEKLNESEWELSVNFVEF